MTESNKIVYIASPYSGDVEQNVKFAIEACQYAISRGCTPIAPHLLYPQILDDSDPKQRELGLKLGKRLLLICDELWLCGEKLSKGMTAETQLAISLRIPQIRVSESEIKTRGLIY